MQLCDFMHSGKCQQFIRPHIDAAWSVECGGNTAFHVLKRTFPCHTVAEAERSVIRIITFKSYFPLSLNSAVSNTARRVK